MTTFSAALFLLIFGLIRGNAEGWGSAPIVLSLGAAVALMAAFIVIELRRENAMLDLSLFRKPSFTGVSIVAFALSAGMFAMFLYLTLYLQGTLAYSPLDAGLRFLPLTVLSFVVAPISGQLLHRVPARAIMGVGMILVGLGLTLMHGIEVSDSWTTLLAGSIVAGIGIGMTNPGIASVAIGVVDAARAGMASGINSTFRQVGIATGTAALGAIFQSRIDSKLSELLPGRAGHVLRGRRLGRDPDRDRLGAAAASRAGGGGRQPGVRLRAQRDPPGRRCDRLRGRDRQLAAGPPPRPGRAARGGGAGAGRARAPAGVLRPPGRIRRPPSLKGTACCTSCGSRTCC